MEKEKMNFDTVGYGKIIKETFHEKQITEFGPDRIGAFGWLITPEPGYVIIARLLRSDSTQIELCVVEVKWHSRPIETVVHTIFNGVIPPTDGTDIDGDFLKKILLNYKSFIV